MVITDGTGDAMIDDDCSGYLCVFGEELEESGTQSLHQKMKFFLGKRR